MCLHFLCLCKICKRHFCIHFLPNLYELQAPQNLDLPCNRLFKETVKSALQTLKKKFVQNNSESPSCEVLSENKG